MIRGIVILLFLFAVGAAAAWLAETGATLSLSLPGLLVELPLAVAAGAGIFLFLLAIVLHGLWIDARLAIRARRQRRQEQERRAAGSLVAGGLIAAGSGRLTAARESLSRALARDPDRENDVLLLFLRAQIARTANDMQTLEETCRTLVASPDGAFAGWMMLAELHGKRGGHDACYQAAARALRLEPGHAGVVMTAIRAAVGSGRFTEASRIAATIPARGIFPRERGLVIQANILLAEAGRLLDDGMAGKATARALAAHRLLPGLVPAAAMAARGLLSANRPRAAMRVLQKTYALSPHPDLAEVLRDSLREQSPAARQAAVAQLAGVAPEHPESLYQNARAACEAGMFPVARRLVTPLLDRSFTRRVPRLVAALDEAQYGDHVSAHNWLDRALSSPPDPVWECASCGAGGRDYQPVCLRCGSLADMVFGHGEKVPFPGDRHAPDRPDSGPGGMIPFAGHHVSLEKPAISG